MRRLFELFIVIFLAAGLAQNSIASEFVHIPGGDFRSVIPEREGDNLIAVSDFFMQEAPVSNEEFMRFVLHNPEWQRGKAVSLFVDDQYLSTWSANGVCRPDGSAIQRQRCSG